MKLLMYLQNSSPLKILMVIPLLAISPILFFILGNCVFRIGMATDGGITFILALFLGYGMPIIISMFLFIISFFSIDRIYQITKNDHDFVGVNNKIFLIAFLILIALLALYTLWRAQLHWFFLLFYISIIFATTTSSLLLLFEHTKITAGLLIRIIGLIIVIVITSPLWVIYLRKIGFLT